MEVTIIENGIIAWSILCFAALVLCIASLISIYRQKHFTHTESLNWILVAIFIPFLGPLLYFKIGRHKGSKLN